MKSISFWENERLTLADAVELSALALNSYIESYRHIVVCYSGGKDSSTVLSLLCILIEQGKVKRPEQITVLYGNTKMEIPVLYLAALEMLARARESGCKTIVLEPPLDDRFFVRMLGRGYPPPHNGLRYCTGLLKINPMRRAVEQAYRESGEKLLMLTGMRIGESIQRDQRIALACSSKDGECGQGAILAEAQRRVEQADLFGLYEDSGKPAYLFTRTIPSEPGDMLSPILSWRVCHIADWLEFEAPSYGFPTHRVLEAYGAGAGDQEPLEARTGCIACPVAGNGDPVLVRVCGMPGWTYLKPLLKLRGLYEELSKPANRLKKSGERNKDGGLSSRPNRSGPLLFEVRLWALAQVKAIQDEVNRGAREIGRPELTLIDAEEEVRILELIEARTWPEKWSDRDLLGTALVDLVVGEGLIQPILPGVVG